MARSTALINKVTLKMIRERKKVSYGYISKKVKIPEEKIKAWENGLDTSLPTIRQAKNLAKCYHVPFAGLYMLPEDINIKHLPILKNMRTVFGESILHESALNIAIMDLLSVRDFILETEEELKEPIDSFSIQINYDNANELAKAIRTYFNITIDAQLRTSSKRKFYLFVRKQIEAKGIMIQCYTGVDVRCARGVSVFFDKLPIIGINDADRYPAKTFTIIHELIHILKRSSTYCSDFYNSFSTNIEEVFCNAVAGELLVPEQYLIESEKILNCKENMTDTDVESLADKFSVSREVIVRRLLDLGYISSKNYNERNEKYKIEYEQNKDVQKELRKATGTKGIPRDIPRETIDKNGESLYKTLHKGYREGLFDKQDIARYLGVNQKNVDNVLVEVTKG
jgi:Zn-dependent peptidase ImmA (M78 family)/transcriptional regulator with XRE-family HTH domain